MKNYKETAISLGASDIASLTVRSVANVNALNFGKDGSYRAYITDDTVAIPAHYTLTLSLNHWTKIYDDEGLAADFRAEKINIYRAGEMGCIVQLINE